MKKEDIKPIMIIILAVVIMVFIIASIKNKNARNQNQENIVNEIDRTEILEDGTKLNTSEKLNKTKILDNLEISNIHLTTSDKGVTTLLANITNKGSVSTTLKIITIKILDENGNILEEIDGVITALNVGESTQLNIGITKDYSNAYDFEIEEK